MSAVIDLVAFGGRPAQLPLARTATGVPGTPRPTASSPVLGAIPPELRAIPRWICWKHHYHQKREKWIKLPIDPKTMKVASVSDPATWADYETAASAYELIGGVDGVGIVFNGDGLVGIDFDKCVDLDTGALSDAAQEAAQRIEGYWEVSPSGRGLHCITRAALAKAYKDDRQGVELYKTARYFTITGRVPEGNCGSLPSITQDLSWFLKKHFGSQIEPSQLPLEKVRGGGFFGKTNDTAMANLGAWVPTLFPKASRARDGYRVTSVQLARDLEEDLSIQPEGIVDFGVHDQGDERQGKRTPIDLVMEWYAQQLAGGDVLQTPDASKAALWLCEQLKLDPAALGWERAEVPAEGIGEIPKAYHLCTDQANAQRIQGAFGQKLMVASGRFYYWTGKHWTPDEGEAYRCACRLSEIVKAEAKRAAEKADEAWSAMPEEVKSEHIAHPRKKPLRDASEGQRWVELSEIATALERWGARCEMKVTVEAAFGLLRKLLTVDHHLLDRDPWALNCLNGTVDLRSGELRPHEPQDRITKLVSVTYDPSAVAPRFQAFLSEILADNAPLEAFVKRWFGYCATASVREQKLVVHIGAGSNGKSTLIDQVTAVLGEYASTAAPGLLTSSGGTERHPTEIADLLGRRMVTAHETDEAAVLREGFVKQATGGDSLKGRWMRADFFEFRPTHKLQLLTNHKPAIRGQDFGIWRRVLLVPYPCRFGTAEEITAGRADRLRDDMLAEALQKERAGILRWIVEGAAEWHRYGLDPPDCVVAAGRDYQSEQDRIGQFIGECCKLDRSVRTPLSGDFDGLYPRYMRWCRENGYQHLGRARFLQELERKVPYFRVTKAKVGKTGEGRRTVTFIEGVRICDLDESDELPA